MHPHDSPSLWRRAGILLFIAPIATACTQWHVQRITPESVMVAHPTRLRVTHTDGSQQVLNQPVLTQDTLVGTASGRGATPGVPLPQSRIALADVHHVSTRGFSPGKTIGLFFGLVGLAAGLVVVELLINPIH